jgi:hypothetical protein
MLVSSTRRTQKQLLPLQLDAGSVHPTKDAVFVLLVLAGDMPLAVLYEKSAEAAEAAEVGPDWPETVTVHAPTLNWTGA